MSGTLEDSEPAPDAPGPAGPREWVGHVIVCGLHQIGRRTVEQLHLAGARVVVMDDTAISGRMPGHPPPRKGPAAAHRLLTGL